MKKRTHQSVPHKQRMKEFDNGKENKSDDDEASNLNNEKISSINEKNDIIQNYFFCGNKNEIIPTDKIHSLIKEKKLIFLIVENKKEFKRFFESKDKNLFQFLKENYGKDHNKVYDDKNDPIIYDKNQSLGSIFQNNIALLKLI